MAECLSSQINRGVSAFLAKPSVGSICNNDTIKKLTARAFKANMPRARYEYPWNVDPVIEFWDKKGYFVLKRAGYGSLHFA